MGDNARYIQKELPNLDLNTALRHQVEGICERMIGTQHDIFAELAEWEEGTAQREAGRAQRLLRWLSDDLRALDEVVRELGLAAQENVQNVAAYVLVAESAVNVLTSYRQVQIAARLMG